MCVLNEALCDISCDYVILVTDISFRFCLLEASTYIDRTFFCDKASVNN